MIAQFQKTPDSDRNTSGVTLFERLESSHALEAILSRPFVEDIQTSFEFFEIEEQLRANAFHHLSSRSLPVEFHLGILRVIYGHIAQIETFLRRNQAEEQSLDRYLSACRAEMVRQVQALFPLYPVTTRSRDHFEKRPKSTNDLVRHVYKAIDEVLLNESVWRGRKALAIQLTSAFCSASPIGSFVSPEAIRARLRKRVERAGSQR